MNHKVVAVAHFALVQRGKGEGAGALHGLVHYVLAGVQQVFVYWQGARVLYALHVGVEVALVLAAVPVHVDCPLARSPSESPSLLVKGVGLRWAWAQG